MLIKPVQFPQDELAHDAIIEWWYFNGHLYDEEGNHYSFMDCLFKADNDRVELPFLSKLPLKTIYFSHSLLSDITHQEFYPDINYLSVISKDSFTKPLLFVNYISPVNLTNYTNYVIEEPKPFEYAIKTDEFDLRMKSTKKPLLLGGNGFINVHSKETYWYSITNLETEGTIKIKGKTIKVKGKSWMDRQWADEKYSKDKWTWFSIQLEENVEIACCEYDDGEVKTCFATVSNADGSQEHFNRVTLEPLAQKWFSPQTKAEYTLSWRIVISAKKIDLTVTPQMQNQEMVFGTINYWEGPLDVNGLYEGQKAHGQGFLELVGYCPKYNNVRFLKNTFVKTIAQAYSMLKKL